MTDTNPYASPAAPLVQPNETPMGTFVPNGRSVDASQGIEWIKQGFRQLFAAPGPWYLSILALYGAMFVASVIPLLNIVVILVGPFANPAIFAGFYACGDAQARRNTFDVGTVFDGFKKNLGPLLAIGGLAFLAMAFIMGIGFMLAGGFALIAMVREGGANEPPDGFVMKMVLAYLVVMLLFVPVMMASWFAPALVLLHNLGAVEAMQQSFNACLKNFGPFMLYGLAALVVCFVAIIPFGLGLLVVGPAFIAGMYPIYADIFLDKGTSTAMRPRV